MHRFYNRLWVAVLTALAVTLSLFGAVTAPAQASDEDGPISSMPCEVTLVSGNPDAVLPPICHDPSGSDQDWFTAPPLLQGDLEVYYGSLDDTYISGTIYSADGRTVIDVPTRYYYSATLEKGLDAPVWRMTFSTEVVATEARNKLLIDVQTEKCNAKTGLTPVVVSFWNVPDASGRYVPEVWFDLLNPIKGADYVDFGEMILDGEVRSWEAVKMVAGRWKVSFSHEKNGKTRWYQQADVVIPKCGAATPSDGDDDNSTAGNPVGKIKRMACSTRRVKVIMNTRKVQPGKTRFVLVKRRQARAVSKKVFRINAGKRQVRKFSGRPGDRFVLRYKVNKHGKDRVVKRSKRLRWSCR